MMMIIYNVRIAVSRKSTEGLQSTHKILLLMLTPVKYNWVKAELASWEYKRRSNRTLCCISHFFPLTETWCSMVHDAAWHMNMHAMVLLPHNSSVEHTRNIQIAQWSSPIVMYNTPTHMHTHGQTDRQTDNSNSNGRACYCADFAST